MNKKEEKEMQSSSEVEVKQPIVIPYSVANKEKKIVCPVCGHANPEYTALCEMCSNYL